MKYLKGKSPEAQTWELGPNYAIKPTPEQALRSNRALPPARLIAALGVYGNPIGDWLAIFRFNLERMD